MTSTEDAERLAAVMWATVADLDAYIESRAEALAGPRVADILLLARDTIAELTAEHARAEQRAQDLIDESGRIPQIRDLQLRALIDRPPWP